MTRVDWVSAVALALLFGNVAVLAGRPGLPLLPYLLLVVVAGYQVLIRYQSVSWPWPATLMVCVAGAAVASTVASPRPEQSLSTLVPWLLEGVVFVLAALNAIRSPAAVRGCAQALVLTGAVIGLLVSIQQRTGTLEQTWFGLAQVTDAYDLTGGYDPLADGTETGVHRSGGMIGDPNFFALAMICLLPWAVYLLSSSRGWVRVVWLAAGLAIAEGVGFSYSRGALVAVAAVLVLFAAGGLVRRRWLLPAALAGAALVLTNPTLAARMLTLAGVAADMENSGDAAVSGRYAELLAALRVWADHPLFGVGPGQFPAYFQDYAGTAGGGVHVGDGDRNAHNLIAGLAADVGAVGLAAFVLLIGCLVVGVLRARADDRLRAPATAALGSLLLYVAAGMFLHLAYARYLWLFVALAGCVVALRPVRS